MLNKTFGTACFQFSRGKCISQTVQFLTYLRVHVCLCATGAEGGSSSQGAAGQSGSAAGGAAGGVSKASRGQGPADKEEQAGNQKRARRQWESWSAEDKNSFFEGLYEVGCSSMVMASLGQWCCKGRLQCMGCAVPPSPVIKILVL